MSQLQEDARYNPVSMKEAEDLLVRAAMHGFVKDEAIPSDDGGDFVFYLTCAIIESFKDVSVIEKYDDEDAFPKTIPEGGSPGRQRETHITEGAYDRIKAVDGLLDQAKENLSKKMIKELQEEVERLLREGE